MHGICEVYVSSEDLSSELASERSVTMTLVFMHSITCERNQWY